MHGVFSESRLLAAIAARSAGLGDVFHHVRVGPGDDCAVLDLGGGPVLLKVDQVVEGRHFTRQTPAALVARKALARAISDIAAMAGEPKAALVSAVLPGRMNARDADELCKAVFEAGLSFACPVVGGDIAAGEEDAALVLSVTAIGIPATARGAVLRSTACVGDDVYVTGVVGGSFEAHPSAAFPFAGGGRHLTFSPRVVEAGCLARALADQLHAMMDTSDGLGIDAGRLAEASGVAIELVAEAIPIARNDGDLARALADGEDYELLFACGAGAGVPVLTSRDEAQGPTKATRIGRVVEWKPGAPRVVVRRADGSELDASALGYEHG